MLEELVARANQAVADNNIQSAADIEITTHGSDFLWAVFSIMAVTGLGIYIHGNTLPKSDRVFHYLSVAILFTASVAYFSLAADLGATPVTVEYLNGFDLSRTNGRLPTRQIWYARYIDWTITTPLLLLELLLVSGLPLSQVFITVFLDEVMIVAGLIGALTISQYKWGYFAMACVAMLMIFYNLYLPGLKSAGLLGNEFKKAYMISAGMLSFLWLLYPVCWGLADGGNQISPDGEMVFYGVLDVLAKPVFALVHLYSMSGCDLAKLQLQSGKFSEGQDGSNEKMIGSSGNGSDEVHSNVVAAEENHVNPNAHEAPTMVQT